MAGQLVELSEGLAIARELYQPGDRSGVAEIVMMLSAEGGVDIEEVAAKTPEKIRKGAHRPRSGLRPIRRKLAFAVGLEGSRSTRPRG